MTVLFVDTVKGYGGGQVVLDKLVSELRSLNVECEFVRAEDTFHSSRKTLLNLRKKLSVLKNAASLTVVANANKSLPVAVLLGFLSKLLGFRCRLIFIAHNYPSSRIRAIVTRLLTCFVTQTICVEPGLEKHFFKTQPAPLLATEDEVTGTPMKIKQTPNVVSFQRADPVKGGFRLVTAYEILTKHGYICKIALDHSIESNSRYEAELRAALQPWLEDGRRGRTWLERGDIFMCSSLSETAALSVQEALLRGCFVISTHIGALSFMEKFAPSLYLMPRWDDSDVLKVVESIFSLEIATRIERISKSERFIESLKGQWMKFTIDAIVSQEKVKY